MKLLMLIGNALKSPIPASLCLIWMLTGLACSHQKHLSVPESVINACPYEHLPVLPGPITEETINNLLLNHDLDHKCIDYLKDLLGRINRNKLKAAEGGVVIPEEPLDYHNGTLWYVTPLKNYYLASYGFTEAGDKKINEGMKAWNDVLPRKIIRRKFGAQAPNVVIHPWPMDAWDSTLAVATTLGLTCFISVRMDLNLDLYPAVISHELGHCFGLGHSDEPDSLMFPYIRSLDPSPDPLSVGLFEDFNPFL